MINLSKIKRIFKDVFFGTDLTCNNCRKEIYGGRYFCQDCYDKMVKIGEDACGKCGRKTKSSTICLSCKSFSPYFDKARSLYVYDGIVRKNIINFKDEGAKYLGEVFADELSGLFGREFKDFDLLVPVPITSFKLKERGYNQSVVIAKELSRLCNKEVFYGVEKVKETGDQKDLTRDKRMENLRGAFKLTQRGLLKGKSIVIVDDVMTTGATVSVLAKVLKRAGAKKVGVITIASVEDKVKYFKPQK